jgi:2-phosphosulfolactate phosphatase
MTVIDFAWGPGGARSLAADCDVLVVVDVLSFTTCVSIATARGATVRPVGPGDEQVAAGELLAGSNGRATDSPSLSPTSLLVLAAGTRLVLPSPNGAALAASLGDDRVVAAAALRNASATAAWLAEKSFGRVGLIAAGERWPDGTLRPSYEDLVGVGCVVDRMTATTSPQAQAAVIAYRNAADTLVGRLLECRSGVELVARNFAGDVALAAEVDADDVVPVLHEGVFVADHGRA